MRAAALLAAALLLVVGGYLAYVTVIAVRKSSFRRPARGYGVTVAALGCFVR